MEDAGLEEALWRVLQQRKGGVGGGGFDGGQEDDDEEMGSDFIEYHLYLDNVEKSADPAAELEAAASLVLEATAPHRAAYPWQQDTFHLGVMVPPPAFASSSSSSAGPEPPHLHGLVRVAEAVEDEWFVVWLLRLATAHPPLAAKGLTARVADADGDFLQIDASIANPHPWLVSAEGVATHRTWIRGGHARFIADDICAPSTPLPLRGALELLRAQPARTAAPWLETVVAARVQGYPDRIASETHHAACFLPPAAAVVLNARPALVAAAVRALGGKDPGELAGLGKGDDGWRFPPGPLVPVWLPFAQRAYGQLQCEEAQPPKAFLGPVAEVMAREGAAAAAAVAGGGGGGHSRGPVSGERVQSALERGVRLACGLEMLYRRSRRRARGTPPPGHGAPSSSSLSWQAYLSRLQARGFFEGVIEGSADHKARVGCARQAFDRRERQARAQRLARAVPEPGGGSSSPSPSPSPSRPLHEWVDELLAAAAPAQVAPSAFPASIAALPPDDDEGWLEIEASQLEAMVARYGQGPEGAEGMMAGQHGAGLDDEEEEDSDDESGDGEGDEDLEALLEGMKGFVGAMGGLEGAEPMGGGASAPAAPVSFDVDRLLSILQGKDVEEALRRGGISSDDEEDSDEEEGQAMMDEDGGVVGSRRVAGVGAGVFRMREVPRGGESDVDSDDGPSAVAAAEERMAEDGEGGGGEAVMMEAYMAHLDRELQGTTLDASFERVPTATAAAAAAAAEVGTEGEGAELPPVDLDLNLVRHLLESVASQGGAPGPATNILGELGFGHTRGGK